MSKKLSAKSVSTAKYQEVHKNDKSVSAVFTNQHGYTLLREINIRKFDGKPRPQQFKKFWNFRYENDPESDRSYSGTFEECVKHAVAWGNSRGYTSIEVLA